MIKIFSIFTSFILFITSLISGFQGLFGRSDVVILYTNDVHCGIEENIGYAGLAAYKKETEEKYENVTLVDCGDFAQGGSVATVSSGEYLIDIMNEVGYDMAILGNHEFDYGMQQLNKLISKADFDFLGCNVTYSGTGENLLSDLVDYKIVDYGNVEVGFIGVSTPESITTSTPTYFQDENGNYIYGFSENLFETVQENVVRARVHGADYVVVLSHLGDTDEYMPCSSVSLIENTVGIDAVLDGHAHHEIESKTIENSRGEDVILSSTGTKLENIGQLKITADGEITASLISDYDKKDADTVSFIESVKSEYSRELLKTAGTSAFDLSVTDGNGVRMTRNRETTIGNLCADSYREVMGADIGLCNGGGVRASIEAGDITKGDILNVHPFNNTMCVIEATGQQIADALEWGCQNTESTYTSGEFGGFLQVSGLKFTVDTSVPTPVKSDEMNMCAGIEGERRVKNITVLENGTYVPLDMNKKYTVAGSEYLLLNNGDGTTAFNGAKVISAEGILDNEVLMNYITDKLGGTISDRYSSVEGRIVII